MSLYNQLFRNTTLIISNEQAFLSVIHKHHESNQTLLISDCTHNTIRTISSKTVNQFLGQEFKTVAYDATNEFNPNAFAAITGCIVGGGELIIHLPSIYHSILNNNECISGQQSYLLYRFIKLISQYQTTRWSSNLTNFSFGDKKVSSTEKEADTQIATIEKIKRCCLGHAKRPIILTADRGRGKSTLLGIAAAELIIESNKNILVVSPRKENIKILMQHAEKSLASHSCESKIKQLSFVAPDQLLIETPPCDLLIVDEAGAIPVQLLENIIEHYNRVVFSTTLNGYEGNGQGFKIRFEAILKNKYTQFRTASINQPWRWANNDPLEESINQSFLLNHEASIQKANNLNTPFKPDLVVHREIKQAELINDKSLLKEVFVLLVEAHYQTRPNDLERMISDPQIKTFISIYKKTIVSVALISVEGKIKPEICEQIEQGKIRIAGNLLPQSLMAYQGLIKAGELSFWRVMRIAVKSHLLRNNIATQLISFIETQAILSNINIIGASFSMSSLVIKFWYGVGYNCSRIALSKDSSTGSTPAEFLKNLSQTNKENITFDLALTQFSQSFLYTCQSNLKKLNPHFIFLILKNQLRFKSITLQKNTLLEIVRYTEKARSYEMVNWHINQLVLRQFISRKFHSQLNENEVSLIISKAIQSHDWETIVRQFDFKGKKTAKEAVKKIITKLLAQAKL